MDRELPYEKVQTHYEKAHTYYEDLPVHDTTHAYEKIPTEHNEKAHDQTYERAQTYEKVQMYEKAPMFDLEKVQAHVRPQLYEGVQTYEVAQTYETLPKTAHELQLQHLVYGTDV